MNLSSLRGLASNIRDGLETQTYEEALKLLQTLQKYKLNIVTVESLTAGMISKMLVDLPTFGAFIYGGFVVYDTDAKRAMVDVTTPNVYNRDTARQMSEGALVNTRSMVSLSVTGQAGPTANGDEDAIGIVDMGVTIRTGRSPSEWITQTKRLDALREYTNPDAAFVNTVDNFFTTWKAEQKADAGQCFQRFGMKCSTIGTLSKVRDCVRLITVQHACRFAADVVEQTMKSRGSGGIPRGVLPTHSYDREGEYNDCGEPSWVINNYLQQPVAGTKHPDRSAPTYECNIHGISKEQLAPLKYGFTGGPTPLLDSLPASSIGTPYPVGMPLYPPGGMGAVRTLGSVVTSP